MLYRQDLQHKSLNMFQKDGQIFYHKLNYFVSFVVNLIYSKHAETAEFYPKLIDIATILKSTVSTATFS